MSTYILQPIFAGPTVAPLDSSDVAGNTIRNVGVTQPVTTSWNVGDVWIDTSNGSTANVVRIWTGTAFSPSGTAALLFDQFTLSDGTAWSTANWVTAQTPTAGTGYGATVLSNQGKITTSNVGGFSPTARIGRRANITNPADANVSFSFKFDSTDALPAIFIRANAAIDTTTGYAITFTKGTWGLSKWVTGSSTAVGTSQTYGFSVGSLYSARFRVVGTTIQARVWNATDSEPSTWGVNTTDSTISAAGGVGITVGGSSGATNNSFYIDNFTIASS